MILYKCHLATFNHLVKPDKHLSVQEKVPCVEGVVHGADG